MTRTRRQCRRGRECRGRVRGGYHRGVAFYLLRRIGLTVPVLLGVATLVFSLIHLVPGDPAQAMLGETASPSDVAELRVKLGLDRPLFVQYGEYLKGLFHGDLGTSFRYNTPVTREIGQRLSNTV